MELLEGGDVTVAEELGKVMFLTTPKFKVVGHLQLSRKG